MEDIRFRQLLNIVLVIVVIILEAGCKRAIAISNLPPLPNLTATNDARTTPSATPTRPTLAPTYLTPNPTVTPLIGGGRTITFQEYNQTLILEIGESFVIQMLPEKSTIEMQDPGIIQMVSGPSDPTQGDQEYQAIASGETSLYIFIFYPCPTTEPLLNQGCPLSFPHFLHIRVLGENTATPNPHTSTPYP